MGGQIGVKSAPGQGSEFFFDARFGVQAEDQHLAQPVAAAALPTARCWSSDNARARDVQMPGLDGAACAMQLRGPSGFSFRSRSLSATRRPRRVDAMFRTLARWAPVRPA